jgi:hypothetical protein
VEAAVAGAVKRGGGGGGVGREGDEGSEKDQGSSTSRLTCLLLPRLCVQVLLSFFIALLGLNPKGEANEEVWIETG